MRKLLVCLFGAVAQIAVGVLLLVITIAQTAYVFQWSFPPSNAWIFLVSMEALAFAAYAIIATATMAIWLDKKTPDA